MFTTNLMLCYVPSGCCGVFGSGRKNKKIFEREIRRLYFMIVKLYNVDLNVDYNSGLIEL